jgi:hypothetical protein
MPINAGDKVVNRNTRQVFTVVKPGRMLLLRDGNGMEAMFLPDAFEKMAPDRFDVSRIKRGFREFV